LAKTLVPDDELWWQIASTITPLNHRRRVPSAQPATKDDDSEAPLRQARPVVPPPRAATARKPTHAELSHDRLSDLDKRTGQKLVRGKLPLEGRLDLHGLTQEQAHGRLARFIATSAEAGKRCVLVITGKGMKPRSDKKEGETGVLRQAVPRWLNSAELRPLVLAIRYAQAKDGGEGALYVLLKRRRDKA
jgi:DNA-nicking Smr family endonuclease